MSEAKSSAMPPDTRSPALAREICVEINGLPGARQPGDFQAEGVLQRKTIEETGSTGGN